MHEPGDSSHANAVPRSTRKTKERTVLGAFERWPARVPQHILVRGVRNRELHRSQVHKSPQPGREFEVTRELFQPLAAGRVHRAADVRTGRAALGGADGWDRPVACLGVHTGRRSKARTPGDQIVLSRTTTQAARRTRSCRSRLQGLLRDLLSRPATASPQHWDGCRRRARRPA